MTKVEMKNRLMDLWYIVDENHRCARALMYVFQMIYRHKDESLSFWLHGVADEYARRPEGRWWT